MKQYLFWKHVREWLDPFRFERATYATHLRVRVMAWLTWALNIMGHTLYACAFALATVAISIIGIENGVTVSPQYIIGLFAAKACGGNDCYSPEYLTGAMGSVGLIAVLFALLFIMFGDVVTWKPADVSNTELEELRMLGYIIFENGEDFENAIHEHSADTDRRGDRAGSVSQPSELDTAGPTDRRPKPEAEGAG